jgi:hypothetical protein
MSEPRVLVVSVFEDEVRAEQAVRAIEVWRRANRRSGLGPIGVVGRRVSGTTTWRARGVLAPGRATLVGLVVGFVLLALPAAGAASLAAYVLGSIAFGLAGLVGLVPGSQVGTLVLAVTLGAAGVAALFAGLLGALVGCLVGLLVAFIHREVRGLSRQEVTRTAAALGPGAWATVARAQASVAPLVGDELGRLGGALAELPEPAGTPEPVPPPPGVALEPAASSGPGEPVQPAERQPSEPVPAGEPAQAEPPGPAEPPRPAVPVERRG